MRLKSSLDPMAQGAKFVGHLAMETIDALARQVATQGNLVLYGDNTHSTRATLDLGTAGDRFNTDRFFEVKAMLGSWARGDNLFCVIDDFQFQDLLNTASSTLANRQAYTESGSDMLYNYELGKIAGVRIVVSPFAKAFYAAGAANGSAVATTLASAATAGATTIEVASASNISTSKWLTIGTVQTSTESDSTIITEIVRVSSVASTTVTIVGGGPGGGLKYDHASGAAVSNADTVHCVVFGTPESLAVEYIEYGRYGKLVPKFEDGNARQWSTMAFKYYGCLEDCRMSLN